MSRNRRRKLNDVSFTIQAGGQHAPLHPSSCKMINIERDVCKFNGKRYRRFSYRECARIQSFPDSFKFSGNLIDKYRQIGNAVPPLLSFMIAAQIPVKIEEFDYEFTPVSIGYDQIISTEIDKIMPFSPTQGGFS